jgi:hypothetical protein
LSGFVSATREIRAPRAQVAGFACLAPNAARWLWAPVQVATINASRDLPDGTRQLINKDGDKLRDRVVESDAGRVVVQSELRPRQTDVPGRHLRYELSVQAGPGTTIATLTLGFVDADAPSGTVHERRWRRHLEGCLGRLAGACEVAVEGD